jgi:hypothetical protein
MLTTNIWITALTPPLKPILDLIQYMNNNSIARRDRTSHYYPLLAI